MKTLYISDLDGTLLNGSAELSEYTVGVLNRLIAGGAHFSIATARTAATTLRIFEKVAINLPMVLMNGVLVYDPAGREYVKKEVLTQAAVEGIIRAMRETGQAGLMYSLLDGEMKTYFETHAHKPLNDFISERKRKYNKVFTKAADFSAVTDEIIYFFFLDSQENIERVYSLTNGLCGVSTAKYRDIYSENLWYLEVFSSAASKYSAVKFLREQGGYEEVIGFGDNLNDIPLLRACDKSFAVANAKDELKGIADAVIGSNKDDGVAKYLESIYG